MKFTEFLWKDSKKISLQYLSLWWSFKISVMLHYNKKVAQHIPRLYVITSTQKYHLYPHFWMRTSSFLGHNHCWGWIYFRGRLHFQDRLHFWSCLHFLGPLFFGSSFFWVLFIFSVLFPFRGVFIFGVVFIFWGIFIFGMVTFGVSTFIFWVILIFWVIFNFGHCHFWSIFVLTNHNVTSTLTVAGFDAKLTVRTLLMVDLGILVPRKFLSSQKFFSDITAILL